MGEIIFNQDLEILYKKAADLISENIETILSQKDKLILGLCGGRSVSVIFKYLKEKNIEWNKVYIFLVDERLVPISDSESNFKLAKEAFLQELFDKGKISEENLHPFILGCTESLEEDLGVYEAELKNLGGSYDIVLLSSGEDGHIGALYPNHHSVKDESEYFISMIDSPKPPPERMSISKKLLLRSKIAIISFLGDAKKESFEKFNIDSNNYIECPARLVKKIPNYFVLTDLE